MSILQIGYGQRVLQINHRIQVIFFLLILAVGGLYTPEVTYSQELKSERAPYILRNDDKLEIVVHIWGEVQKPGEYMVQDGTNALELISMAGGPTDFSNLRDVVITRSFMGKGYVSKGGSQLLGNQRKDYRSQGRSHVINLNLQDYLDGRDSQISLLNLQPGDIVRIKRNSKHKWSTVLKVATQAVIILQAAYWYTRIN